MDQKIVLIVDDSSLARMMMKNIIIQSFPQWTILEAKNAEECLAHVKDNKVALALLDFNMPGMNGIDLAAELMDIQPDLSIHIVTANIQEKMKLRADAMGIGFIRKPVSLEKLSEAMAAG